MGIRSRPVAKYRICSQPITGGEHFQFKNAKIVGLPFDETKLRQCDIGSTKNSVLGHFEISILCSDLHCSIRNLLRRCIGIVTLNRANHLASQIFRIIETALQALLLSRSDAFGGQRDHEPASSAKEDLHWTLNGVARRPVLFGDSPAIEDFSAS